MDGAFERLNHATLQTAPVDAQVISLVGKAINFDGVDTATIEAADGGQVQVVQVDVTTFNYAPNMICEIMGSPLGNNTVQVSSILVPLLLVLKSPVTHNNGCCRYGTCNN